LQAVACRLQRGIPLTWVGWCLLAAVIGLHFWSPEQGRDEVSHALFYALATVLGSMIFMNWVAQFFFTRSGEDRRSLQMQLPSSALQGLEVEETQTGWAVACPFMLQWGLFTLATMWRAVDSPRQIGVAGRASADGREWVSVARRGFMEFRRQLQIRDVFNLTHCLLETKGVTQVTMIPPHTGRLNSLNAAFPNSEEGWSQYGKREGDYFDIQSADPQTPRRLLLWKLGLKTGTQTIKYRRAPEPVDQHRRRLGVFFQVSEKDGPAAAFLYSSLQDARVTTTLFGTDWHYADSLDPSNIQPGHTMGGGGVRDRVVQAGSRGIPPPSLSGEPLAAFIHQCRPQGIFEVLVFHGPDWKAGADGLPANVSLFRVVGGSTDRVHLHEVSVKPRQFEITVS
ncbi:MAG: hypothetical protein ACOYNP_18480, partial [Gemmataceae bacterium]